MENRDGSDLICFISLCWGVCVYWCAGLPDSGSNYFSHLNPLGQTSSLKATQTSMSKPLKLHVIFYSFELKQFIKEQPVTS